MDRWEYFNKVCEKLSETDPDEVVQLLNIESEELISRFETEIDTKLQYLIDYFNITDDDEDLL